MQDLIIFEAIMLVIVAVILIMAYLIYDVLATEAQTKAREEFLEEVFDDTKA